MKKTARGSFHQITDVSSSTTLVRYNDNNIVNIASTESKVQQIGKVKQWCNNKRVDPHCYQLYTKFMGEVDRLDQHGGIRLKRWHWQMMMFPINVCVNNAYQLYRLSPAAQAKNSHNLLSFTWYIVQSYLILGKASSSLPKWIGTKSPMPTKNKLSDSIRLDGKDQSQICWTHIKE